MTPTLDRQEQIRLAALIDACGSINVQAGGRIRLAISHRDPMLLIDLKNKCGGTVDKTKEVKALGRTPRGKWTLVGQDVGLLLKQLRPFLRSRALQADLAIAHYEQVDAVRRKYQRRTTDQQMISIAIEQRLKMANRLNTLAAEPTAGDGDDLVSALIKGMKKAAEIAQAKGGEGK